MRPERLCLLAQRIAEGTPDFFETKGPGKGDHATAQLELQRQETGQPIGQPAPLKETKL
jgi:hypothetical protein